MESNDILKEAKNEGAFNGKENKHNPVKRPALDLSPKKPSSPPKKASENSPVDKKEETKNDLDDEAF